MFIDIHIFCLNFKFIHELNKNVINHFNIIELKIIPKDNGNYENLKFFIFKLQANEIEINIKLNHPNIFHILWSTKFLSLFLKIIVKNPKKIPKIIKNIFKSKI